MSEAVETTQPAQDVMQAPAPALDGEGEGEGTEESRRERVIRRLRERRVSDPAHAATEAPGEPRPDNDNDGGEEEEETPETDRKPPKEPDDELALKNARLSRELRDARADLLESREKARRYDALGDRVKAARASPYQAVALLPELFGMDFGQLADFVVQNEDQFRQERRMQDLPPELREELALARKEREERKRSAEAQAREAQNVQRFSEYKSSAERFLNAHQEDYPLTAAVGWGPGQIARMALDQGTRDARKIVDDLEKSLRSELTDALSKPDVVRALCKGDRSLADKLREALGAQKPDKSSTAASFRSGPTSAYGEGPRALTNGITSSDTASPINTRDARRAKYAEAFKAQYGRR